MSTLSQASTGGTVKLNYRGVDYRGILLKHKALGTRQLILTDSLVNDFMSRYEVGNASNIISVLSDEMPAFQARLPKDVGDTLREQYALLVTLLDTQYQAHVIEHQRKTQLKTLETTNAKVMKALTTQIYDTKRPLDVEQLRLAIRRDLGKQCHTDKTRNIGRRVEGGAAIVLSGLTLGKNNVATIRYILQLSREEQVMSKEFEDRIRGNECVSQRQVNHYTPIVDTPDVIKIFGPSVKILETKTTFQEEDKGWVTFYRDVYVETVFDVKQYEKNIITLAANLDKTYPEVRY